MNGIERIAAERKRQIEREGWTLEHDDTHTGQELNAAAVAYAAANLDRDNAGEETARAVFFPADWDAGWWKPSVDPIRNLEKAGALIAAEIDRLQRLAGES